ncbi:MAG: cytochrome c biogenesis protein CcsA [Thermoplasmatota archaeon]
MGNAEAAVTNLGQILLDGALLAAIASVGVGWRRSRFAAWLSGVSALLTAGAFLWLVSRFILGDLSVQAVFLYTRTDLDLRWRIAGAWVSREGSLLLWTTYVTLLTALMAWLHRRCTPDAVADRARLWTRSILGLFAIAFLWATVRQGTFAATPAFYLAGRPLGNGLNPTLRSGFILIHPPVMFLAYALTTVPAAAALAHMATGTAKWSRLATGWSRVNWLLYSLAIGLGGMWAYYTLGFGGYWAWDPVEVANLLPWLALTVYLHAQLQNRLHGSWGQVGPFLGLLPFLLTLFSTISTRSGLWVSVHAFTNPTNAFNSDPAGRFMDILGVDSGLPFFVGLFLATLAAGLGLWCYRLARDAPWRPRYGKGLAIAFMGAAGYAAVAPASAWSALPEAAFRATALVGHPSVGLGLLALAFVAVLAAGLPALLAPEGAPGKKRRWWQHIDRRGLAAYSIVVLGLALVVLFIFHVASVSGGSFELYESRLPWIVAPGALGLIVLQAHGRFGRQNAVWIAAAALALAGLAAAVAARFDPEHVRGWFLATLGVAALAVGVERLRHATALPGRPAATLLWISALVDVLFWANPPSTILGFLQVGLPLQAVGLSASAWAVWKAQEWLAGGARHRALVFVCALLAGFYVALPLALAAYVLDRRGGGAWNGASRQRVRQGALYGIHLALALLLVGFAASTEFRRTESVSLLPGVPTQGAGVSVNWTATEPTPDPGTPYAAAMTLKLDVPHGQVAAPVTWESTAGAHFPWPGVLRTWSHDVYADVESVHVAGGAGSCSLGGQNVVMYQAAARLCATDRLDGAAVAVTVLPGLGLVWAALMLGLFYMATWMRWEASTRWAAPAETS